MREKTKLLITIAFLAAFFFIVTGAPPIPPPPPSDFSAFLSGFDFKWSDPSSGTFTANVTGTGCASSFTSVKGSFSSEPIDATTTRVYATGNTNTVAGDNMNMVNGLTARSNFVVDLGNGKITGGDYMEVTYVSKGSIYKKGTYRETNSTGLTASGTTDATDFSTTTMTLSGNFAL